MQRFEGVNQPSQNIRWSLEQIFLGVETKPLGSRTIRQEIKGLSFGGCSYEVSHSISNGRFYSQDERIETYIVTEQEGDQLNRYIYQPDSRTLRYNGELVEDESKIADFVDLLADVIQAKSAAHET